MAMRYVAMLMVWATASSVLAQTSKLPFKVISSVAVLDASVRADSNMALVSLPQFIPGIVTDIRYATPNNFTHKAQYASAAAYMRLQPARALRLVQQELKKKGLGLKIYDAYRPYKVTCALWESASDRHYVANPRKGSQHNRAIAADLTIIELASGRELDMGTGFDNFTDSAHHAFSALPAQVLANRRLLKNLMWKHGFNYIPTEWWHYHWRNKRFDVLDIPFSELEQ